MEHSTPELLSQSPKQSPLRHGGFCFYSLEYLNKFFYSHRIPRHQWWMQVRPLLRILAHYVDDAAVYETDVDP